MLHPKALRRLSISSFGLFDSLVVVAAGRRVEQSRHRGVVVAVARPHGLGLAGFAELLLRVLAHGLEQPVPRSATGVFGRHQRLVDQQGELIEDLVALHFGVTGNGLGGVEVETAEEDREPPEQNALGLGQQGMRPVHRRAQRLLPTHRCPCATGQEAEAVVQAADNLLQRECTDAGGGQLDRQRHAVEPLADLGHGGGVVRRRW